MKTPVGEINIAEQLLFSELKTDILKIANSLSKDDNYTKVDVVHDLMDLIYKFNL